MNPLELTRKTPMSNCGACGYTTCLAFSAAVLAAGENGSKCPFLTSEILAELPAVDGKKFNDLAKQNDFALAAALKEKISSLDFRKTATAIGADYIQGEAESMIFEYLARPVEVTKKGITLADKAIEDPRDQILLCNYVIIGGGRHVDKKWIGLESLPNSISKVRTLAVYAEEPIAKLFQGRLSEDIIKISSELKGISATKISSDITLTFPVLPLIPLQLHYWREAPEEGFEAKVKILFPENVLDFLDIESLVFASERLADSLAEAFSGK